MKKLLLLILLCCAETLFAQTWYIGESLGVRYYNFRQSPGVNYYATDNLDINFDVDFPLGLAGQYVFKNNLFGIDANVEYEGMGVFSSPSAMLQNISTDEYFFINPLFFSKRFTVQIGVGGFYVQHFTPYINPNNDFGPAWSLYFAVKLSKRFFIGLQIYGLYGLQRYYEGEFEYSGGWYYAYQYSEQYNVNYSGAALKLLQKF